MSRVATSQVEIVNALLSRLRAKLGLDTRTCYLAVNALDPPTIPKGGQFFVVLGVGDGAFPPDMQAGAGEDQCTEACQVTVAMFSRLKTDQADHAAQLLRQAERGLLRIKWRVLRALVGHDLLTSSGDTCLRQTIHVLSCTQPTILRSTRQPVGVACIAMELGITFDWDLS